MTPVEQLEDAVSRAHPATQWAYRMSQAYTRAINLVALRLKLSLTNVFFELAGVAIRTERVVGRVRRALLLARMHLAFRAWIMPRFVWQSVSACTFAIRFAPCSVRIGQAHGHEAWVSWSPRTYRLYWGDRKLTPPGAPVRWESM
jgi:hypothetical protein